MTEETVVSSRPDREVRKKIITPGNHNLVPYEESRCKVDLSYIRCTDEAGDCPIDPESRVFSQNFDGNILIGDNDCFIDRDFELILQHMCCKEICEAKMVYRDGEGKLAKEISCTIELQDATEEQLISDWGWMRLYEASIHHKEKGVELVKEKRIADAFRRFNKSLKMLIAVEPIDPNVISEDVVKEMIELKVKLYNNLAHCQLQFNEYVAAVDLCNRSLTYDPDNVKALYRRGVAQLGLKLYEEAWRDIQQVLSIDPSDKAAQQKASIIRPEVENIKKNYSSTIKKMFE